ncbi:MAG: hypothetical protein A3F72_15375 [Bacteroidetes bacterium RIFCSPLOWO2_12_FULL_35_15]|nr:MAG: hypothetical protein A3F72_15375 [Bacteroidetes bacterium RIFCSPLOWO2_12_FULL_35_15]
MKTTDFETYKQELIPQLKAQSACQPEFKRVLASNTMEELQKVLGDNFQWCVENKIDVSLVTECNNDVDLRGCDLKGITLPSSIGGYLDLRGCDLKGITLPGNFKLSGDLYGATLKQLKEASKK